MKRSGNTILFAAIGLIIIAVVAIMYISVRQTQRVQDTAAMVAHTHDVMQQTERLLGLSIDNVTNARGYLLTGLPAFREKAQWADSSIRLEMAGLGSRLKEAPDELLRLDTLQNLVIARLALSQERMNAYDRGEADKAIRDLSTGNGIDFLEAIRKLIQRMQEEERELLLQRRLANEAAIDGMNNILIIVLSVVFLVLLLLLNRLRVQKNLQDKAKVQDRYLATLVNQVSDAIISTDQSLRIASWNAGAVAMYGWTEKEVLGKPFDFLLNGESDRQQGQADAAQSIHWEGEQVHRNSNGKKIAAWVSRSQLTGKGDEPAGQVIVVRDISAIKEAERKLKQYNEALEAEVREKTAEIKDIFERVNDGVLAFDANRQLSYINLIALQLLQQSREELSNARASAIFTLLSAPELDNEMEKSIRDQVRTQKEVWWSRQNKWLELTFDPSFNGTTVFIRDITDRRLAEEALRSSEERYQELVEQASDGIFMADVQGNYLHVNSSACQLTGYSREELLSMNLRQLITRENQAVKPVLLETIPSQGAMLVERQILRKDGQVIDVEISARKLPDGRLQSIVRDITDRKKAALALAESEAKFKNLVEQSLVGVYIIQDNRFVYVNPQMSEMYGYTREEMLAMPSVLETVDPAEKEKVSSNLFRRITGEVNSLNYEFVVRNKLGETLYIEVFGNRILYNGQPAIIGTAINNTQRKKAEREIERSNERFMLLARATNDAMWDWDMLNDQVWWNEKHYALYGLDPKDKPLDFESWKERIHPADRDWVSADLERALSRKKSMWEAEYRFRMPDGKYGNVYDRVYIVYENGQLVRMLGSVMDITQRVKAEEQLKASEQKYKLLFEYNPLPMWMLSLPDRKFIDVNEAAIKQYGYSREEFMHLDILAMRPPDDVARFVEQIRKQKDGIDYAGIWRHIRKNGDILEVEIITHEIHYQERPALLVLAIDVTEKQQYERRIKETNAQLRELSAHLQDIREEERLNIAREIHDELGQLLTVLKMDVSWLKKKMPDSDEKVNLKLAGILELLDKTVKTVRRIATELRPSILDDLGLLAALEWQAEEFRQKSGIPVEVRVMGMEASLPAAVNINLFRIFQESLTNIARHAQAGKVVLHIEQDEDKIVMAITDDGRGFNDEQIRTRKTLGLLGMKERAVMNGGKYRIISRPGEGTRVEVEIPLAGQTRTET